MKTHENCGLQTALLAIALALTASHPEANAQRVAVAKDLIADEVVMHPIGPMKEITLTDLVPAKIVANDDEPKVIMMVEALRTEKRMATVTRVEQQKRTRKVPDKDGNLVDQEFIVAVEVTEDKEIDSKVPAGRKPVEFAASAFRFYDLNGKELDLEQAAKQLSQLRPMFLLDGTDASNPEVPDLYRQALRDDCLIGVTAKVIRDRLPQPMMRLLPAVDVAIPRKVVP